MIAIIKKLLINSCTKASATGNTALKPLGIVIHDTATAGATAENEYTYFSQNHAKLKNPNYAGDYCWPYFFVDDKEIIQTWETNKCAVHAGYTANRKFIGIEMCVPKEYPKTKNQVFFDAATKNTIDLVASLCKQYGFNPDKDIYTHHDCTTLFKDTNHIDPDEYFPLYAYTKAKFIAAVKTVLNPPAPKPPVVKPPVIKPTPKPVVKILKKDCKIKITGANAVYGGASKGVKISPVYKNKVYTVQQVGTGSYAGLVLIEELVSWVYVKDITLV